MHHGIFHGPHGTNASCSYACCPPTIVKVLAFDSEHGHIMAVYVLAAQVWSSIRSLDGERRRPRQSSTQSERRQPNRQYVVRKVGGRFPLTDHSTTSMAFSTSLLHRRQSLHRPPPLVSRTPLFSAIEPRARTSSRSPPLQSSRAHLGCPPPLRRKRAMSRGPSPQGAALSSHLCSPMRRRGVGAALSSSLCSPMRCRRRRGHVERRWWRG